MQIGQAARASGASAKMIRHYEAIGLIAPAERRDSNYRIRDLLALWTNRGRSSAEVKSIALAHIAELEDRIAGMRDMVATLHDLADGCAGNDRPDCPIIEGLAGRVGTRVRLKGGPSRSAGAA